MKEFTNKCEDYYKSKYPVTSARTGAKYLVKIKPFYEDDTKYYEGCFVSVCSGSWFGKELYTIQVENKNFKIGGKYDYNLINLAKYAVENYEQKINRKAEVIKTLDFHFNKFKEWNGEV